MSPAGVCHRMLFLVVHARVAENADLAAALGRLRQPQRP